MSTQQMTLSWTGTPLVALAEETLILPWLTIDQSKMCKENMNLPCVALFLAFVRAKKTDFLEFLNLKVTTYTSFFRQCKSKIKPWGG